MQRVSNHNQSMAHHLTDSHAEEDEQKNVCVCLMFNTELFIESQAGDDSRQDLVALICQRITTLRPKRRKSYDEKKRISMRIAMEAALVCICMHCLPQAITPVKTSR